MRTIGITEKHLKKEKVCRSLLIKHIADSQLEYIKDKSMAMNIYDALKSVFERNSVAGQLIPRKQLNTMKYEENKDMSKHLLKFDNTIRELKGIGAKLEEIDVVCQLLLTMPKSYGSLVTSSETLHPDTLNMEFVKSRLLDKYTKRNVEKEHGISSDGNTAMVACKSRCHNCDNQGNGINTFRF